MDGRNCGSNFPTVHKSIDLNNVSKHAKSTHHSNPRGTSQTLQNPQLIQSSY